LEESSITYPAFSIPEEAKLVPPKRIETKTDASGTSVVASSQKVRVWMQVVISLILLITGILVLLDPHWLPHFDESTKKIAAGWVGAVIGYWLS
jgi:cytochrome b subunit of formate dehydrogenase